MCEDACEMHTVEDTKNSPPLRIANCVYKEDLLLHNAVLAATVLV